jgi:hypothetical protein
MNYSKFVFQVNLNYGLIWRAGICLRACLNFKLLKIKALFQTVSQPVAENWIVGKLDMELCDIPS